MCKLLITSDYPLHSLAAVTAAGLKESGLPCLQVSFCVYLLWYSCLLGCS